MKISPKAKNSVLDGWRDGKHCNQLREAARDKTGEILTENNVRRIIATARINNDPRAVRRNLNAVYAG